MSFNITLDCVSSNIVLDWDCDRQREFDSAIYTVTLSDTSISNSIFLITNFNNEFTLSRSPLDSTLSVFVGTAGHRIYDVSLIETAIVLLTVVAYIHSILYTTQVTATAALSRTAVICVTVCVRPRITHQSRRVKPLAADH